MLTTYCLCCGYLVEVRKVNSKYIRANHHGRNRKACSGSRVPVAPESVMQAKIKEIVQ